MLKEKQEELKNAERVLSHTTEQLEHYLEIGCNKFFVEKVSDTYLITQKIQEEGHFFINYLTNGYTFGIIFNEKGFSRPQYVFKKANSRNDSNSIKSAGTYACIYQSFPSEKVAEIINSP